MDQLRRVMGGVGSVLSGSARHVLVGGVLAATMGVGVVVVAAGTANSPSESVGSDAGADRGDAPAVGLPEIGDQPGGETNPGDPFAADGSLDAAEFTGADQGVERVVDPVDDTRVVQLGDFGSAELDVSPDGVEVISTELIDGWIIDSKVIVDGETYLIIRRGEELTKITITTGGPDGVAVRTEPFVIPDFSPTTTEPPTTTTEPPADVYEEPAERFTVDAPGIGSFVVERDGDKLTFVGMVSVAAGLDHEIVDDAGWKVVVRFTDGEQITFAKAYLDDDGVIHQSVWVEEVPFEPVYQWVEVPGVGAVQFKLWTDGLIYVKEWHSECCELHDANEGVPGETARVDFEGPDGLWIIDVWSTADGQLEWSVGEVPAYS